METIISYFNSAGNSFVDFTLPMLIQSSILIIILLGLDLVLRRKVTAVVRYGIWMLVLVKLLLPPTLTSPTGLGYWMADKLPDVTPNEAIQLPGSPEVSLVDQLPAITPPEASFSPAAPPVAYREPAPLPQDSLTSRSATHTTPLNWQATVFGVWSVGVITMVLLLLQRLIFVKGLISQSDATGDPLSDALRQCCRQMGMRRRIILKLSPNAASPSVCGLFRPVILIPHGLVDKLTAPQLRAVLLHELAHIKRGDLWVSFIQTTLQILYFYNPLLWLANAFIRKVREQAVDEMVLVAMGKQAEDYPNTLLNVSKLTFRRPALSLRLIGVVESKSALKTRIKHIVTRPIPKTAKLGIMGLLAILITAAVLLPMASGGAKTAGFWHTSETAKDYKVTSRNGSTIELIAINMYPSHNKKWWRPNGELLDYNIVTSDASGYSSDDPGYEFVLKKIGDCGFIFHKIRGSNVNSGITVVEPERLLARRIHINKKYKKTTLEIAVESGKWETILETKGGGSVSTKDRRKRVIMAAKQKAGNATTISSSDDLNYKEASRIIAIDADGKEHTGIATTDTGINGLRHRVIKFDGILPNDIKMFEFQTCPYDYYKFKNISLKPNFKTDVQVEFEKPDGFIEKTVESDTGVELKYLSWQGDWEKFKPVKQRVHWKPSGEVLDSNSLPEMVQKPFLASYATEDGDPPVLRLWFLSRYINSEMIGLAANLKNPSTSTSITTDISIAEERDKKDNHGVVMLAMQLQSSDQFPEVADIDVSYAVGPWKTVAKFNTEKGKVCEYQVAGGINWNCYMSEKGLESALAFDTEPDHNTVEYRHVLVGHENKKHSYVTNRLGREGLRNASIYKELKLEDLRKINIQKRQRTSKTFKNVSLQPDHKTDVEIEKQQVVDNDSGWKDLTLPDIDGSKSPAIFSLDTHELIPIQDDDDQAAHEQWIQRMLQTPDRSYLLYVYAKNKAHLFMVKGLGFFGIDTKGSKQQKPIGQTISKKLPHTFTMTTPDGQVYEFTVLETDSKSCRLRYRLIHAKAPDLSQAKPVSVSAYWGTWELFEVKGIEPPAVIRSVTINPDGEITCTIDIPDSAEDKVNSSSYSYQGGQLVLEGNRNSIIYRSGDQLIWPVDSSQFIFQRKDISDNFTATLPNGVTVELLGVCEHPSEGKQWWWADGSLLKVRPYAKLNDREAYNDLRIFEIVYRLIGPGKAISKIIRTDEMPGYFGPYDMKRDIEKAAAYSEDCVYAMIPVVDGLDKVDINIACGTEADWQWHARVTSPVTHSGMNTDQLDLSVSPGEQGYAVANVTHRIYDKEIRVIAKDKSGKLYHPKSLRGKTMDWAGVITAKFDISTDDIESVEVQTQEFQTVVFKNISLKPNFKTAVQVERNVLAK